jgi:hypothetical protein
MLVTKYVRNLICRFEYLSEPKRCQEIGVVNVRNDVSSPHTCQFVLWLEMKREFVQSDTYLLPFFEQNSQNGWHNANAEKKLIHFSLINSPPLQSKQRRWTWTGDFKCWEVKLDFAVLGQCKPVLLGLSLAGNLVKPLLSLYGTEWRERGYGLRCTWTWSSQSAIFRSFRPAAKLLRLGEVSLPPLHSVAFVSMAKNMHPPHCCC